MLDKNNKILLLTLVACGLFSGHSLYARELRTPLSFLYYWWTQYPLERPIDEETCWQFELLGGAYHRESSDAFLNKNTTDLEPLAGPMFGQASFTLNEAYPNSTVPSSQLLTNPLLNVAEVSPKISYNENGAYWGFAVDKQICDSCWRVGLRGTLPVRRISVELDDCCDLAETLDDVRNVSTDRCNDGTNTVSVNNSYAYRLDFLSALRQNNADLSEMLVYGSSAASPTTLASQVIARTEPTSGTFVQPPVNVVKSEDSYPDKPFLAKRSDVATFSTLSSTGNGSLQDEDRRVFAEATNYTGVGNLEELKANQRALWIVPTAEDDCTFSAATNGIRQAVENAVNNIGPDSNPVDFLDAQGINFRTSHLVGLGDFITQVYANWANQCYFFEGVFGVVWPTARREKDSGDLLRALFPRGNNKHFEVQVAALGGWDAWDWLKIKADVLYSHVIKRSERVAASFEGATVKNINPGTCANVSWNYFVADLDFTVVHPQNCDLGFDAGYQAYVKLKDNVSFKDTQATTLSGTLANLDSSVLELRTKVVAHKLRIQGFWQTDYLRVYGGWNHVFAGKNAPRETDWYLAAGIYF